MHALIIAAFSLLVSTVYASPIYRGEDIEILKRDPEVWHEFEERGIKEFFDNLFHPAPKCHATKGMVKDTLGHLTNITDGPDSSIKYYDIDGGFGGQPAVLTKFIMPNNNTRSKEASKKFVKNQVKYMCQTKQFLNWGVHNGKEKENDTYYVVTRKMGVSEKNAGLNDDSVKNLQKDAVTRYHKTYHLDAQSTNATILNFVYHNVNGHWNAEITNATTAKLDNNVKLPKVPKPQSIS